MRHFPHHAFARLLAAVYLFVAAGPGVALVLCVDADGRQGIESALAPDCCAKRQPGASQRISHEEHSCDCVDTPLVLKATAKIASQADIHPPLVDVVLLQPRLSLLAASGPTLWAPTLRGPPADVTALRSVILLL